MNVLTAPGVTKRMDAGERIAFRRLHGGEPAMGTLEERLNIIILRQGGRLRFGPFPGGIEQFRVREKGKEEAA